MNKIIELKNEGLSSRQIAAKLGVSKSHVNDVYNRWLASGKPTKGPRILFFDLETAPSIAATFGRWNQNISNDSVIREGGFILSAAWKMSDSSEVHSLVLSPEEAINGDDHRIVMELFEQIEDCQFVCAHNLDKFDLPILKTRLVVNGFPQLKKVKQIDTLKIAKQLKFNSNKLDALCKELFGERKIQTEGIKLWIDCLNGNKEALSKMQKYNIQDVVLLQKLYNAIKGFDDRHPNVGLFHDDGKHHCPVCGSEDIHLTGNVVTTQVSVFTEYLCDDCGHRSRSRKAINTKEQRSLILI